jgi:hypothetical protein
MNRAQAYDKNHRTLPEGHKENSTHAERSGGGDVAVWPPGNEAGGQTDLSARWNAQAPT